MQWQIQIKTQTDKFLLCGKYNVESLYQITTKFNHPFFSSFELSFNTLLFTILFLPFEWLLP